MALKTQPLAHGGGTLRRTLGLWAIVGLGLGYMTPTVVFDTFGMVARDTDNAVPAAYAVALVVMVFTAISYGKISRAIPSAGSAYTYVRESMHPNLGFMVGWTSLIDYALLPLVNCLIIRSYLEALFPDIPGWIWVVIYCVLVTAIIYMTMRGTSNVNMILLVFSIVVMAVFVVMVVAQLARGEGAGTVMPGIGTLLTGLLWVNLHGDALRGGLVWTAIGFVYLLVITRGFRRRVAPFDENQAVTGYNKTVKTPAGD